MHEELLKNKTPKITLSKKFSARPAADLLITYAWKEGKKVHFSKCTKTWDHQLDLLNQSKDFKADASEVAILYAEGEKEKRLAVVGLGKKSEISSDVIRKAYRAAGSAAKERKLTKLSVIVPLRLGVNLEDSVESVTDGLLFSSYTFSEHKCEKPQNQLKSITLLTAEERALDRAKETALRFTGVALSKDLINLNADVVTPQWLGDLAKQMAKSELKLKATVFDKARIQKEKMGLLLAVSQGSTNKDPRFIILEYNGAAKSKSSTVLIGKGVTYDTGGLNLKPTGFMETMKSDMSGASIVLSTVYTAAKLGLKCNVTAIVPATENAIGPESFKPGDVYTAYNGTTVEIGNTDAEGRLVLADAISWAEDKLEPDRIIDVATLTGAIAVALGEGCAGLFTPDDKLANALLQSSDKSGEMLWRMPLIKDYNEKLKSHVADTSNIGNREGGAISAALFLQKFVKKTPWAHLDIAGVAFTKFAKGLFPKHATGYGVRLLINYLSQI